MLYDIDNQKPYEDDDILDPELSPTASASDMTGLIPSGITDGDINDYNNVYPYLAGNPDDINEA